MTGTITKDYGYFRKGDKVEFVEYFPGGWKLKDTTNKWYPFCFMFNIFKLLKIN